jgi:hypothetical protein
MKKFMQSFSVPMTAVLAITLCIPTAFAQDPAAQAAQQANDQAIQASQQATQQALQMQQQAIQQATQQAQQQAAQDAMSSSSVYNPPQAGPIPDPSLATPIPSQIATAHTIFLSNLGADTNFPIDPNQAYTAIYDGLQNWGRYQLVSTPQQADLIFQLHELSTYTTYVGNHGSTYTINNPSFVLTIVDANSNVTLWTISSPVYLAGSKSTLARWESIAETNLVSRIKVVAGQSLSTTESADLVSAPKGHRKAAIIIASSVFVGVAVGGPLLLHHLYENSLASQKASQDAFCNANHIPLSECAGG